MIRLSGRAVFFALTFSVILYFIYDTTQFGDNESETLPEMSSEHFIEAASRQLESTERTPQKPQSLILAYYRSGSSFLGELLSSVAGSYFNFEPLSYLDAIKLRDDTTTLSTALDTLRHILQCNYTGLDHFFRWKGYKNIMSRNGPLWKACQNNGSLCSDANYVNEFCAKSQYYVTKVVRLLAYDAETLLTDSESNIKILLLIRDPRGVMLSRRRLDWCHNHSDCISVSNLCKDMEDDFQSAIILTKAYPQRFKVVRYEDLSTGPYDMTEKILKFYGLPFEDKVRKFLATHTKVNMGNEFATFRDSKTTPFEWIERMSFFDIQEIQTECSEAMALWGYKTMDEKVSLNKLDFYPLVDCPFSIDDP